jgi:tetratricopeptide (TPR) repeat protein
MSAKHEILQLNRMAIFTPGRQTDDELKTAYIARIDLLQNILDDIAATRVGGIPQHHLVIGQRGMGKTTLLRRIDVALRELPRAANFIPLSFPEEQWTIDRLSALWLNCLDSLADTLERENSNEPLIKTIDEAVKRLRNDNAPEDILAEAAEKDFLAIAAKTKRRAVLLVDNLDLVFGRLNKHELYRLRAFLMKAGAPVLIGVSVYPPKATQDYNAPFYDQFKTHYLSRLSLVQMREVLLRLAEQAGNEEIIKRLEANPGRLHALHALTGGNTRTTVILFQIFARGRFSDDAYHDLETLLDWMTPLYKARFEELSPQAQVIISTLATIWEPATSARVCDRARLENRQVSAQLDRLKKAGIIEEVTVDSEKRTGPIGDGRSPKDRAGYQLAERFFNIWFLMRQATRRDKNNLIFLTRLIECIHTPDERDALARELLGCPTLSPERRVFALALEPVVSMPVLGYLLHDRVENECIRAQRELKGPIDEIIDPAEIPQHKWAFHELRERLIKAVPPGIGITGEAFADAVLGLPRMIGQREKIASKQVNRETANGLMVFSANYTEALSRTFGSDAVSWFQGLLRNGTVVDFTNSDQAGDAFRRADTAEKAEVFLEYISDAAKACLGNEVWDGVLKLFKPSTNSALAWKKLGQLYAAHLHRFKDAEEAFRRALEIDHNDAAAWGCLGTLLGNQLKRYNESEAAYKKTIEIDPASTAAWLGLGYLYNEHLNRKVDAETAYLRATELDPNDFRLWNNLGNVRSELGKYAESEAAYRKAIELNSKAPSLWRNLGVLFGDRLGRYDDAESCYRKAIEVGPNDALTWRTLGKLLVGHLRRYEEAASAFRQVAILQPKDPVAWYELGNILADFQGKGTEAAEALRTAISLSPSATFEPTLDLVYVLRDLLGQHEEAERLLNQLGTPESSIFRVSVCIHEALFAAYAENWGSATKHLAQALDLMVKPNAELPFMFMDWTRATAVLLHLGFGERLRLFLSHRGEDQRLRPWYEALRAILRGDRLYVRNIPAEMQKLAETLYNEIEVRLRRLPESTRHWSTPDSSSRTTWSIAGAPPASATSPWSRAHLALKNPNPRDG